MARKLLQKTPKPLPPTGPDADRGDPAPDEELTASRPAYMHPSTPSSSTVTTSASARLAVVLLPSLLAFAGSAPAQDRGDQCQASHRVVIAAAEIGHEPGDVTGLSGAIAERVAKRIEDAGQQVVKIVRPTRSGGLEPSIDAFSRHAAPYFLRLAARDLGTDGRRSGLLLVPDRYSPRAGELSASLDDGARGARLDSWRIDLAEADGKPFSPEVTADSTRFWESDWGRSLDAAVETLADDVIDTVRCRPLVGRVLSTEHRGGGTDLRIDLGRDDGLAADDRLLVIEPGMPADWLGVNLLTRPDLETTVGPVREPRSLGDARVSYLGERDSTLRYGGDHGVESGDLVQVSSPTRAGE